jgi:hypothetical protein
LVLASVLGLDGLLRQSRLPPECWPDGSSGEFITAERPP